MDLAETNAPPENSIDRRSDNHITKPRSGSTVFAASLNLTNSILGAGCIGYGGAIAQSGGLISIFSMLLCAILSKVSFDVIIALSLETKAENSSYEELASHACGFYGMLAVLISKGLFSFGCLVAYIIIVRDNFSSASRHLFGLDKPETCDATGVWCSLVFNDDFAAFILSATVMLPLSLLRDMTPLASFSALKISSLVLIVLTLCFLCVETEIPDDGREHVETNLGHWLLVRPGFIQNTGTFVFTFVAQHTVHLVYQSLRPEVQNIRHWKIVSSLSIAMSTCLALPIGLFAYFKYWEETTSDLFSLYPPQPAVDIARLLLCLTMLLTYPMPLFSFRELIIVSLFKHNVKSETTHSNQDGVMRAQESDHLLLKLESEKYYQKNPWLLSGDEHQLHRKCHVVLTVAIWAGTLVLALLAPSLGDVLNLVGCLSGSLIAFILPGVISYQMHGYTFVGSTLFTVGVLVGCVGTFFSVIDLLGDL